MYNIEIKPSCQRDIEKLCKKNPVLREALEKKMNEIVNSGDVEHYKNLRYNMKELSYKLFFKAFSNRTRFEIIKLLRKGPCNVSNICKKLNFEQSMVSHNLKCLEACGFVSSRWNGKNKIYLLDKKHITMILDNINKRIEKYSKRLEHCGILKNESCGIIK